MLAHSISTVRVAIVLVYHTLLTASSTHSATFLHMRLQLTAGNLCIPWVQPSRRLTSRQRRAETTPLMQVHQNNSLTVSASLVNIYQIIHFMWVRSTQSSIGTLHFFDDRRYAHHEVGAALSVGKSCDELPRDTPTIFHQLIFDESSLASLFAFVFSLMSGCLRILLIICCGRTNMMQSQLGPHTHSCFLMLISIPTYWSLLDW